MEKPEENKPCPVCGSMLPYDKWLKVIGIYEEQQKHRKQLEQELSKTKEHGQKLKEEYKKVREKERQLKNQYAQKIREERAQIKEMRNNLKSKEHTLKTKLEQKFKLRQEKLQAKVEREKQRTLNKIRKEGMKIGSEKERAKIEKLKNNLKDLRDKQVGMETKLKQKFQQDQEKIKIKLEREKRRELKKIRYEGVKSGVEKQKARTEKVSQMAEKYRKARDVAMEKAKQLEEMIKKGTTPQIEGFDFERELAGQLKQKFPKDDIKPTGHKGDIIQVVQSENKSVGKIIYECKKTKEFKSQYIEQVRRDKNRAHADYGVIVTWAGKKDKQGFWVEGDIIVVHPYGILDIATFLRETLVQTYTLKLSKSEFETKGKSLLEFMQSEEFRSRIQDSIDKSIDAYKILKKEVKTHINIWKKRSRIYDNIHRNTDVIKNTIRYVLLHGKIPGKLPETKELLLLPVLAEKIEYKETCSPENNP